MKKVIYLPNTKNKEEKKPVEFTHCLTGSSGYIRTGSKPYHFNEIVYLGRCPFDGDMFVAYDNSGDINIYKGHLNSGKY